MVDNLRRIAVELLLVAVPTANLDDPDLVPPESVVTDGFINLGVGNPDDDGLTNCQTLIDRMYQYGKVMINLCGNRLRVETKRGFQNLTFKAADALGKNIRRAWLGKAFGPQYDGMGTSIGLSQAGRTRVIGDLKRGLISRREATFLGIQFSLLVASRFKVLQLKEWDEFRRFLFKQVYETPKITSLGKTYKKFTTALGNHLLKNKLLADPMGQLRVITSEWIVAKRITELLIRLKIDFFKPMPGEEAMWLVAHLTQSRFLPGPSRSEVLTELIGLKERLCGDRADQWSTSKEKRDSISSAAFIVGSELTGSKGFRLPDSGHLSLSNSGCIEFTRREGGKLALLWTSYKEFINKKVSDVFPVTLKRSAEIEELKTLSSAAKKSVREAVRDDLTELVNPWGIRLLASRHQEYYQFGNFEKDRIVLENLRVRKTMLPFIRYTADELEALSLESIPVFRDHPELAEYVPTGTSKTEAFQIAMINLGRKIDRLTHEFTGTYDLWGNTICADSMRELPIWKIAYLESALPDDQFLEPDHIAFENGLRLLDTRAGVDSRFGRLLFLWSTVEFQEWEKTKSALPVEAVPISEPGVKSRVATKSLIWVNLFLSPASHFIKDIMLRIPGCRVGLKGADHAWNFEASWGRHCDRWSALDAECISTSDLTAATDFLEHDMGVIAMKSFLDGVGITGPERKYLDAAIELNASARLLIEKPSSFVKKNRIRNVKVYRKYAVREGFTMGETSYQDEVYSGFITKRGLLMGEPLTKMMLSLFSIAAERSSRASTRTPVPSLRDYQISRTRRHIYACAGDDHIGVGKFRYLAMIPKILEFWSGVISWDKYCISHVGAHYCQDFLLLPRPGPRYAIRIQDTIADQVGTTKPKFKIDHIPIRLLSDRRKTGPDVFEEPNPFPGKSKALCEILSWQSESPNWVFSVVLLQKLGLGRWFPAAYLKDSRSYVPQIYGGRGIPSLPGIEHVLSPALQHCIANISEPAVRVANTSGISRKVRGLILKDQDTEFKMKDLSIPTFSYEEVVQLVNSEGLQTFGSVSYTATHKGIREDFMTTTSLDIVSQKVAVAIKSFRGPSVLKEAQASYESRMRHVARAQDVVFKSSDKRMVGSEELQRLIAMRNGPHREERYIRRSDIESVLPHGWIPSFTITVPHLGGSASLQEMGDRVLPQYESQSIVSAPIERDAISMSDSGQDHSSLGSIGGNSYN